MLDVRLKKTLPGFTLDVSFSIDKTILAILGPSGCGKTMTLKIIAGLIQPDEGYIKLNGRLLLNSAVGCNLAPQQRKVGFVFQNYALFPHLDVYQNIAFGIRNLDKNELDARVAQLLNQMHLNGLGQYYPNQLSGGQQQRVAIARALATDPEVLLLDEPFSATDTQVKEQMERELHDIHSFYRGDVLFVTHNLSEAYRLSSQIAVIESGHIIQIGDKEEIIDAPVNCWVACFTGIKNLVGGVITKIEMDRVWIWLPEWGKQVYVSVRNPFLYKQNQRVTVGIRSEFIRIADSPGENAFSCEVCAAVTGVASFLYRLHLTGIATTEVVWESDLPKFRRLQLPVGYKCYMNLPPERLCLIDTTETISHYAPGVTAYGN